MIRRDAGNSWRLISQVEHARLAADLAAAWGNEQVPQLPVPDQLVRAICEHDHGWWSWELSPEIDPVAGWPRNFTEMPMTDATWIWSASVRSAARGEFSHAEALRRFEKVLARRNEQLSPEDMQVLDAVLEFRLPFTLDDVIVRTGRANAVRAVNLLRDARVIDEESSDGGEYLEVTVPPLGPSPLPGIWVSRHFCHLAEQARAGRAKDPGELAAIDAFLAKQSRKQAEWRNEILDEFAGEHRDRLIEAGFHYLRFFDWLSLWLCTAERTRPEGFDLPSGGRMQWSPLTPSRIEVDPWPFSVGRLELTAPARQIPARVYHEDSDLHQELLQASVVELCWELRPR